MPNATAFRPGPAASAASALRPRLAPLAASDLAGWRALYARIGGPYAWTDRDAWSDTRLAAHLAAPGVRCFRLEAGLPDAPASRLAEAGFLELARGEDGRVEIVYLGLDRRMHGHGLGAWLLAAAVDEAWHLGASGIWLHTCTLDGPAALPNYLARGFVVTRTERYTASS